MTHGVAEISVDEVFIQIVPNFYALPMYGTAEIDEYGSVITVHLDGYINGEASVLSRDVPSRINSTNSFDDRVILIAADEIERQCRDLIAEKLDDWRLSLREREYAQPEAAE